MIYDRMVHVMFHACLKKVKVSFEFLQTSDGPNHIRLFDRAMPYTPSHVLHKDRRVGAKAEGNTIDDLDVLCKSSKSKALIHLFVKMIQPGPHAFFREHEWVRSVIEHIVFFTERARKGESQAMKKTAPEPLLFMG
jgi:hypothetical protein